MNIISYINKINQVGKYLVLAVVVLNLFSVVFASGAISSALDDLCKTAKVFLGIASMLMIILAGAIYAVGQILGAETRARAAVWATAMLTGAVVGALIYLLVPSIVNTLLKGSSGPQISATCA
ncbi:hypothetical protein HZC07_04160 [Candidatus Micrarchaeota archaeon]|nr:hypothetical protein [Candidatus Micrarchaeota archaeon]